MVLTLDGSMTLGKLLNLSKPQLPHFKKEINNTDFTKFCSQVWLVVGAQLIVAVGYYLSSTGQKITKEKMM